MKYEEVYLHGYESVTVAHEQIARYLAFYNGKRAHLSLDGATPDDTCFGQLRRAA